MKDKGLNPLLLVQGWAVTCASHLLCRYELQAYLLVARQLILTSHKVALASESSERLGYIYHKKIQLVLQLLRLKFQTIHSSLIMLYKNIVVKSSMYLLVIFAQVAASTSIGSRSSSTVVDDAAQCLANCANMVKACDNVSATA